jgi:hypothetical protein
LGVELFSWDHASLRQAHNSGIHLHPLADALSRHVDRSGNLRNAFSGVVTQQDARPLRLPPGGCLRIPQAFQLENLFRPELQLRLSGFLIQRATQPSKKRFAVRRIVGGGDLWVTEFILTYDGKPSYTVSITEFKGDKVAWETQYFAHPFEAPAWRAQWVERMDT